MVKGTFRETMTKRNMQTMMAFLTEGEFWPKQLEEWPQRRTQKYCSVLECSCKGNGAFDEDEQVGDKDIYEVEGFNNEQEDDSDDQYKNKEIGTSDSTELLPKTALKTKASIHVSEQGNKQDNDQFQRSGSRQRVPPPEELAYRKTPAASTSLKHPLPPPSAGLESGISQGFIEDLKEILTYVLQRQSERGMDYMTVVDGLGEEIAFMIEAVRKEPQGPVFGVTEDTPTSPDIDPEEHEICLIYDTFRQQFDEIFERALEKERDFKKAFPGASTNLRVQVVQILRMLRKAVQNIPDQVVRHKTLMSSIRVHGLRLERACRETNGPVSRKRRREEGAWERKGSHCLKTSSRHCEWCSWKVYTRPTPECDCCASWKAPNPRGPCQGCHPKY